MNHEDLWKSVLGEMEFEVSRANFATWFKHTSIKDVHEGVVTVAAPNAFAKEWLEKKFHKNILRSLRSNAPQVRNVAYIVSVGEPQTISPQKKRVSVQPEKVDEQLEFKEFSVDRDTNINPKYTFESFVIGTFNEFAHAAALAITKNLGSLYNPFFVYGGVGLGKTHLLHAIGNQVRKEHPDYKVLYLTSEKFVNELVSIIQNREPLHLFKEKYRSIDLLIIDDVQFIAGKAKSEEEFFHTFNTLYERGKQVIFSSDKPPKAIPNLEERLRSRFEAGLTADISEPEYEARLAILKLKAMQKEYAPTDDVLEYIASSIQKNVRELEGALNIVVARSKMRGHQLEIDDVKQVLEQMMAGAKKVVSVNQIIKTVATFYELGDGGLNERSRRREVVKPRQVAMYLMREDYHGSYPMIGQKLGGRDHTTALHAYLKISEDLKKDSKLVEELKQIRAKLYES
ncbi:MAG: chromosomal replication initiator protein DnaA [Candidatus Ryanbacteria bacterium]|nr:chromosomal replication initiator protein DnaA [Candidatus Ryanbacteria bacterium]